MNPIDPTTTNPTGPTTTQSLKSNLGEAGSHLKQAAQDTGQALKGAASAAGDELRLGRANVKSDLSDTALAGMAAAGDAAGAAREQADVLMEKGRDLIDSAAELIRERPLAAFGTALAAGWVISRLTRGNDR